ncbi:MAG: phosphoethanolamine transferase [Prevotella sp.]|nr:phosphoethanolamine transferase [Prevotella sp.]
MRNLRIVAHWLLNPITVNRRFFVTMYVLGVLCAVLTLPDTKGTKLYDNLFTELFLDVYLACVVLTLIPQKVRAWVRMLLYAVLYAVAIVDVYCFWKFGSTITPTMLLLVSETDSREAGEFLRTYLSADVIFSPLQWIFLLMLLHLVWKLRHTLLRLLDLRQRMLIRLAQQRWRMILQKVQAPLVGGLGVGVMLILGVVYGWQNKVGMTRLMTAPTIGTVEHILTEKDHAEFYLPIYRLAFSVYSNELAAKQIDRCIVAAERAKVDSCSYRSPQIVLIIGESYGKVHSQLYGYRLPTTPRQEKLEERGLLTKFSDVVSCWNLTSFVFKNFLSMHVIGEKGEWCDYPLFPELFRKAGYRVTFLTNQFLPQAKEAVYDFSGGFFLNNPTLNKAQFDLRNEELHRFDEGLLSDYDNFVKDGKINPKDHNFIIFHLIGQHVSYRTRCPNNQRVFGPEAYEEARPELDLRHRKVIADYDNAVHYNDSIVDAICKRFENQEAIVVYMPDHGEECYEPGRDFICRNHSAAIDWPLAHYEFEVPFWIFCSHKYAVKHPEVFKAIKDAKDRRFMTDALPHLMVWLAGIATKDYQPQYNILSPEYNEMRPRILKNSVDYDKLREAAFPKKDTPSTPPSVPGHRERVAYSGHRR